MGHNGSIYNSIIYNNYSNRGGNGIFINSGDGEIINNTFIDNDIVFTGDQHRAEIGSYNNVLMVAGSCWQSSTLFEEKVGAVPDPCKVPLFNLKTREVKIVDFSHEGVGDLEEVKDV